MQIPTVQADGPTGTISIRQGDDHIEFTVEMASALLASLFVAATCATAGLNYPPPNSLVDGMTKQ